MTFSTIRWAAMAGTVTLALASGRAEADIIYQAIDLNLSASDSSPNNSYDLTVGGQTIGTFVATYTVESGWNTNRTSFQTTGDTNYLGGGGTPVTLSAGDEIPGVSGLSQGTAKLSSYYSNPDYGSGYDGAFAVASGYLGLAFDLGGKTVYGWVQLSSYGSQDFRIQAFAYDNTGASIDAGQTVSTQQPVPEPSTLAVAGVAALAGLVHGLRRRARSGRLAVDA